MNTRHYTIPIGTSRNHDSTLAGQEAARMAASCLGTGASAGWALAFSGGRHDRTAILQGLRSQLGQVEIVGGSTVGIITGRSLGYSGYECAVAAFPTSIPKPTIVVSNGLDKSETQTGHHLGASLREMANDGDTVLLLYDSIRSGPPPVLYVGSRLLDGLYQGLNGKELKLIGAGTIGDFQMQESFVLAGQSCLKHTAVAVVMPSVFQSHTTIMHGCMPTSSFLEITKIDGAVVYELDGRPALDVLLEMMGQESSPAVTDQLPLTMTLGKKHGDLYAPHDESLYVNRLILGANPKDGSVTLFEADFQAGDRIQMMARDNQLMVESVRDRSRELLASLGQETPVFALYTYCAGRSSSFSGAEVEEAGVVQAELGADIPLLGFYSGVEIAPLLGRSRPLDRTGVLTLFTLKDG